MDLCQTTCIDPLKNACLFTVANTVKHVAPSFNVQPGTTFVTDIPRVFRKLSEQLFLCNIWHVLSNSALSRSERKLATDGL